MKDEKKIASPDVLKENTITYVMDKAKEIREVGCSFSVHRPTLIGKISKAPVIKKIRTEFLYMLFMMGIYH